MYHQHPMCQFYVMMVAEPKFTHQMQAGGSDRGDFALVFIAICFGHPPGKFQFNQQHMRSYLIGCLEKQQFTMFAIKKNVGKQGRSKPARLFHSIGHGPLIKHLRSGIVGSTVSRQREEDWVPGAKWFCSPSCFPAN